MESQQASDPKKMRDNIVALFEKMPDDTRDIIAQFWILALQEYLPRWKQRGEAARKASDHPGGAGVPLEHTGVQP